jgi:hypothetical protein
MRQSLEEISMRILLIMLCGLGLLGTLPVNAASADKESTYEIEVVVFENRLPDLIGDELLAKASDTHIQKLEDVAIPDAAVGETYLYPTITNLLEQDGHYHVLAHQHWQQTIDAKTIAKPVRIIGDNPAELEGVIRFYMSRYLHLDVDLLYRQVAPAGSASGEVVYRLTEQRKVRSQEVHYFDHPKLGVLVRVMPVEPEKEKGKEKL